MGSTGKLSGVLKKYTMLMALVVVVVFFYIATDGKTLNPQNTETVWNTL